MADEKPWPLVVTSTIADLEAGRIIDPQSLLEAHMRSLHIRARKMLEAEGRMGDIRRLTLACHNEDKNIVQIVKDQPKENG